MRVLWFTNIPLDEANRRLGRRTEGSGFWMHALVEPLRRAGVDLAVVTANPDDPAYHFVERGTEYFNIPQNKLFENYDLFRGVRTRRYLMRAASIVQAWSPDVIHVHGTERFFGLIRSRQLTAIPTVVSIQGLVGEYEQFAWGSWNWRDLISNTKVLDIIRNSTPIAIQSRFRRQSPVEREILRGADAIVGRTDWDHAHALAANPSARWFHVDEMLREPFWNARQWDLSAAVRGTLMTTSGAAPLKGLAVLLEAVSILKSWGHSVRLLVAGTSAATSAPSGLVRYLARMTQSLDISQEVVWLGWQGAEALADRMRETHCFITPSFIENGCNALSEAQLVGLPCVASHTGGMSTTVRDGDTGLLFSRGDPALLAKAIEKILRNDELAVKLGANARLQARARHDPARIIKDLLGCYGSLMGSKPPASGSQHAS